MPSLALRKIVPFGRDGCVAVVVVLGTLMLFTLPIHAQPPEVQFVDAMPSANHPEMMYWFWQDNTLAEKHYLKDVAYIADRTLCNLIFITDRMDRNAFYDFAKMHGPFAETVAEAHRRHIKIGLQLWAEAYPIPSKDEALALVTEGERTLDASGHAEYFVKTTESRNHDPIASEILKVYAFQKTGDGVYEPGSLQDITAFAKTTQSDAASVRLSIDAGTPLAGRTAYILVAHYHAFPDLFNDVLTDHYRRAIAAYADIPFDGTALDEFGYMMVVPKRTHPFRDRWYGKAFAAEFEKRTSRPLDRTLLEMRYAPADDPATRIRAIDAYFDLMRQGPMRLEQVFHDLSKQTFGPDTFAGIHDTFHNRLTNDEIWRTGLNWWQQPREYGQSDEDLLMPSRMGILAAHPKPIEYDQYYGKDIAKFTLKAIREAPFNGRTHYHGYNDTGRWGLNLADKTFADVMNPVEAKIRLLNAFDPAPPKLPTLIIFGLPAHLNWYPDADARSEWDINGKLGIEDKARAVWDAGFPCALVPSDLIDTGKLTLDEHNHPAINGRTFDAVVYLYPQYAKPTTLDFLKRFTDGGGNLMLEGTADRDFAGNDISEMFKTIIAKATVRGFDVKKLPELSVAPNDIPGGGLLGDGSVILTDYNSIATGTPKPFKLSIQGHEFAGGFIGAFAIRINGDGRVEKLAAGGFSELKRDGQTVLSLEHPADLLFLRKQDGQASVLITGPAAGNRVATLND